jgi:hypothetical protein
MIDLARLVSSRDTGVSAERQLAFHGKVMLSPLKGAVMHFVLHSQMMATVHGQKIVNVVIYCSYTEASSKYSLGKGVLQRCSVCTGKFLR